MQSEKNEDDPYRESKLYQDAPDPLRWMEEDPARLKSWLVQQQKATTHFLSSLPEVDGLQGSIAKRIASLSMANNIKGSVAGTFFTRRTADADQSVLMFLPTDSTEAFRLIDPSSLSKDSKSLAISFYYPSPSGRFVVFGLTQGGSEESSLHVFDCNTRKVLEGSIDKTQYPNVVFLPDESGFIYVRHDNMSNQDSSKRYHSASIRLHKIAEKFSDDRVVASTNSPGLPAFKSSDRIKMFILPESHEFIMTASAGGLSPSRFYFKNKQDIDNPNIPWNMFISDSEGVTRFTMSEASVFVVTNDSRNFNQIEEVQFPRGQPIRKVVRPGDGLTLSNLTAGRNELYSVGRQQLQSFLLRVNTDTKTEQKFPQPFAYTISEIIAQPKVNKLYIQRSSYLSASEVLEFNRKDNIFKRSNALTANSPSVDLEIEKLEAVSYDGTVVPYVIVRKKGLPGKSPMPAILDSYAAYGINNIPGYENYWQEWLSRGGILAYCMARGGGELGDSWHQGGQRKNKENSVKDTIACADDLVKKNITTRDKLGFKAGSAGGIIAGAVIAKYPNLFRSVWVDVGALHIFRVQSTASGSAHISEFGDIRIPEEEKILMDLDGYFGIKEKRNYPAVLISHGYNDSRVPIWMSSKFAGQLQAHQSGKEPILMRTDFNAGHGLTVSGKVEKAKLMGDVQAFFMHTLGLTR